MSANVQRESAGRPAAGEETHPSAAKPREGPNIREFLRYYVLVLLKDGDMSAQEMRPAIEEKSAGNREYRPERKWRLTAPGQDRLASYEEQKEAKSNGKEKAARKLLKLMGPAVRGETVLDVGTGEGFLALKAADEGYRVLGIDSGDFDYSKDSIRSAIEKAKSRGGDVEFREVSVADLVGTHEGFDYVVTSQAMHCMKDQGRCLEAVHRLLKPGGAFLCMDFLVGLEGFMHHGWHSFLAISRQEWRQVLPQRGFEEVSCHKVFDYLLVRARKRLGGERES